ncbi:hypothetical protein ACSFA0_25875 [Variovorax sp. LT1P1]|uniref:hypothetical protein n=1 Tax=Variovorax sp. LT1P1 TaxID=3443730 RepID=UPI003F47DE59
MTNPTKRYSGEWDAKTRCWAAKPRRDERPSSFATFERPQGASTDVWRNAVLIVGLVFALIYPLVALATR